MPDRYSQVNLVEIEDAAPANNRAIDASMKSTVWELGGCSSFYFDRTGRNATLWPDWTWRFRRLARRTPAQAYHLSGPRARELVAA